MEMDRLLRRQSFDLIVLDAMLPGEDGFIICRNRVVDVGTPFRQSLQKTDAERLSISSGLDKVYRAYVKGVRED